MERIISNITKSSPVNGCIMLSYELTRYLVKKNK